MLGRFAADWRLFLQLFVTILVATVNGSIFCFALFSPALERAPFNFDTRQINVISTVGVITSYFSLPTGQLYDRTSPRITLLVGTGINIVGWLLMFSIFSGSLSQSVGSVAACYAVTQLAATFFETGSVLPNLDAFALHEGRIVIIQKTFMGLGSSVIATWYNAFFLDVDVRWFFLFLCAFSGVAGGLGAYFVRRPQHYAEINVSGLNVGDITSAAARRYDTAFHVGVGVLAANMLFYFVTNIVEAQLTISNDTRFIFGMMGAVLAFLFVLMLAALPSRLPQLTEDDVAEVKEEASERASLIGTFSAGARTPLAYSAAYVPSFGTAGGSPSSHHQRSASAGAAAWRAPVAVRPQAQSFERQRRVADPTVASSSSRTGVASSALVDSAGVMGSPVTAAPTASQKQQLGVPGPSATPAPVGASRSSSHAQQHRRQAPSRGPRRVELQASDLLQALPTPLSAGEDTDAGDNGAGDRHTGAADGGGPTAVATHPHHGANHIRKRSDAQTGGVGAGSTASIVAPPVALPPLLPRIDSASESAFFAAARGAGSPAGGSRSMSRATSRFGRESRASSIITNNPRTALRNPYGLAANAHRRELWLMWYVSFATWGAMALVNSNTAQIYKAIVGTANFRASRNTVYVSLFGLGSALGRVVVGYLKTFMERRGRAVWWFFPVAPVLMALSLPLFLLLPADGLFVPFFLIGFGGGVAWGATVLIIKRVFTEAGRHYSFLYTAGMLTPLFFNLWLFSSAYESRSREQNQSSLADCDGVGCITMPICVATGMNVLALPLAGIFARRLDDGYIFD